MILDCKTQALSLLLNLGRDCMLLISRGRRFQLEAALPLKDGLSGK